MFYFLVILYLTPFLFMSRFRIACCWHNACPTATNNIPLVYITVNWSAAAVRIITCWCLQLGREGLHLATSSGEFPYFFVLSSTSRPCEPSFLSQMPTEKLSLKQTEEEMDSVCLIRDTLRDTLENGGNHRICLQMDIFDFHGIEF